MTKTADEPKDRDPAPAVTGGDTPAPTQPDETGKSAAGWPWPPIALAALLGGALSLLSILALQQAGVWPAPQPAGLGALEARVAAMEAGGAAGEPASMGRLESSLERLRDRVAAVEARPVTGGGSAGGPDLSPALNDLSARVDTLARRIPSDFDARLAGFATTDQLAGLATADQIAGLPTAEQIAELTARIGQLEVDIQHTDVRRAARALALAQLVRATQGAAPFEVELTALAAVRPDDARLAQLAPFASAGAPTFAMLRADFDGVARRVTRAAQAATQPTAWDRVWSWLRQAISFRRTDAVEGDGAAAVVARAEARLAEGNLNAALIEMQALDDGARAEATDWIAAAEARVALDAVTTAVAADILADLAG